MSADAKDEPEPWRLSSRGRLTRLSGGGLTEARCYDGRGWVTQVANVEGDAPEAEVCGSVAEPLQAFAYEYDGRGNRTRETWTSGVVSEQTTYAYDLADRLTGVAYPSGPTVLYDLAADGTRLGEKHLSSGPPNLSFETTAGLTKHLEYVNNTAGQLGEIRDGLTQATVATLGYDAAGRTTSWAQNGQTRTFTWDVEDRLRGVDWSGGASARYDYDHSGMRLSATMGEATTRFVWGAGELLEEQAPGGTVHRYLREGELVVGVSDERLLHDALGTIVGRRSAAGVVASHRFDAWGNYNASTAPPSGESPTIGYTGHHVDTIAGLTYAKARWYAPELGRFLSTDPIAVTNERLLGPVGLNTFAYANANPLMYTDPDGKDPRYDFSGYLGSLWNEAKRTAAETWWLSPGKTVRKDHDRANVFWDEKGATLADRGYPNVGVAVSTSGRLAEGAWHGPLDMVFNPDDVISNMVELVPDTYNGCSALLSSGDLADVPGCTGPAGSLILTVAPAAPKLRAGTGVLRPEFATLATQRRVYIMAKELGADVARVRVRHYTRKSSLKPIEESGVLRASDQNSVFTVKAKGRISPRDVEEKYGIKPGKGGAYVEFDAMPSEFKIVKNKDTGATEWVFEGDVDLTDRNPKFEVNR